ncbi:MAG TPA: hypothetical protein VHA09_00175 [Nitrososphaera sp.]|nr:hypothetical protein [Nitrososphaera sp.]
MTAYYRANKKKMLPSSCKLSSSEPAVLDLLRVINKGAKSKDSVPLGSIF